MSNVEVEAVKSAMRGRWRDFARSIGIADEFLSGEHGPCPKCQGNDRWRVFDDFEDTGGALCNQCGRELGDGLALAQWFLGCKFPEALSKAADFAGVQLSDKRPRRKKGAKVDDPAENLQFLDWNDGLAATWCALFKPGITPAGMLRAGCKLARYRNKFTAFALPVWGPELTAADPVGWCLYNVSGGTLPVRDDESESHVKVKLTYGSSPGVVGPVESIATAATVWKVEGVTDLLALLSIDLPGDVVPITNANGANENPKPWMLDLLAGKQVFVLHDADQPGERGAAGYEKDGRHRPGWVGQIATKAAGCWHVRLPYAVAETHGKDLRDYLGEGHVYSDLKRLADQGVPGTAKESEPEDPGTIKRIADEITQFYRFAQDAGGRLYLFAGGTYSPKADAFIQREVKRLVHSLDLTSRWSSRLAKEVIEYIRVDAPALWERPPVDVVNVLNGLLHVPSGELREHTPDHLTSIQLPVRYDPAARCEAIDRFVSQIFPEDSTDLAWEIPAWLMVPDLSIQKAVLLVGEGGNGKSRYLELVQRFLGKPNTSGLSLHRLEADRFCVARLLGKLANICPDLPSEHLASTSTFKALTGGDSLVAEYKFRDSFELEPFSRLLFSANHLPQSKDGSHGFFRRWLVVPFHRTFDPAEQIDQATLDATLSAPGELSGLLNRAVEARRRLDRQHGFTETASTRDAVSDFRATTDPLAVWLDRFTIEDHDLLVAKAVLQSEYNSNARSEGMSTLTANAFGRAIRRLRPTVKDAQRVINGKLTWAYVGIGLAAHCSHQSRDSREYPLSVSRGRAGKGVAGSNGQDSDLFSDSDSQQIRANPVNPVNAGVSAGSDCIQHDYVERSHGNERWLECQHCGKFYGHVR